MARQIRVMSNSGIYHVMIRGNERKEIFLDDEDKMRFIEILKSKSKAANFLLYAYCLMDNHVHLLINEGSEGIGKVMKRINVSYVYYFNKKYKRVGHLFQDRFKSETIDSDGQLLAAVRYIHNNPVKAGIVSKVDEYIWSSYLEYVSKGRDKIINPSLILEMFLKDEKKSVKLFKEFSYQLNEDKLIDYEDFEREEKIISENYVAGNMVREFLDSYNLSLDMLKERSNKELRDELIIKLKNEGNFSIRRIAELLDLGRGIVQIVTRNK